MVDIFGPALIPDRFGAAAIKETDVEVAEAHDVVSGLEFGDANELAGRCLADEDELAFPHDLSVRCIR
jgi:hypothetical protein